MKKRILAMPLVPAATSVKPKKPAITDTIKNMAAHLSITAPFKIIDGCASHADKTVRSVVQRRSMALRCAYRCTPSCSLQLVTAPGRQHVVIYLAANQV